MTQNDMRSITPALRTRWVIPFTLTYVIVTTMTVSSEAQIFYNFERSSDLGQTTDGIVLAKLELSSLPASHAEIVGLTFTPAGETEFGFGPTYNGVFDSSTGSLIDDGNGTLISAGSSSFSSFLDDIDPPETSRFVSDDGLGTASFDFVVAGSTDPDRTGLVVFNTHVYVQLPFVGVVAQPLSQGPLGYWRAVPEPSSIALMLSAFLGLFFVRSNRMQRQRTIFGLVLAPFLLGSVIPTTSYAATFQGLGDLPGGNFLSAGDFVSSDGAVVIGQSASSLGFEPFRWTSNTGIVGLGLLPGAFIFINGASADGSVVAGDNFSSDEATRWTSESGMVGLGHLPGDTGSSTDGVSADGSTIVGTSFGASDQEAFRWTSSSGMVGLGHLPGGTFSNAGAVSSNGTVVVGTSGIVSGGSEAFRWTSGSGMVGLGHLPGGTSSSAGAISADGSVIVGDSNTASGNQEAFRWTSSSGMAGLGLLPGATFSVAYKVSVDGTVVVGDSGTGFGAGEPFRWTSSTGMVGLGDLPGGAFQSFVFGMSADGSVLVGSGNTDLGSEAFIWDETHGMRNLKNVLENDYGLDLTGWLLDSANAVSDDKLTIVGSGLNPDGNTEAWVVNLAPTQPGDFNDDGSVDGADFLSWQRGESPNGINSSDLADWEANYGASGAALASSAANVPEPSTSVLAVLALSAFGIRRTRFRHAL